MTSLDEQHGNPSAAARRSQCLRENFRFWCGRPRVQHLASVLVLVVVALLRWWSPLSATQPLGDEPAYRAAFAKVAADESPYDGTGFVYPAVFAVLGAQGVDLIGLDATMYLLRAINLIGLAVVVWTSMAWLSWPLRRRLYLGAAFIVLAPQISNAILLGNVSLAVAGMVIAGLVMVQRAPVMAGLSLGASIALKPIAPMAVVCLVAARRETARSSRWLAAGTAGLVAFVLLAALPHIDELIELLASDRVMTTVSLHRLPKILGFDVNALWISGPLALVAIAVLARVRLGPARFLCFTTTASLVVLPLVWSHTLVLLLPLQALALSTATDRLRSSFRPRPGDRQADRSIPRWLEPALVVLAIASLQFSAGAGSIDDQKVVIQLAGSLLPALAPIGLLAYLLAHTEEF